MSRWAGEEAMSEGRAIRRQPEPNGMEQCMSPFARAITAEAAWWSVVGLQAGL